MFRQTGHACVTKAFSIKLQKIPMSKELIILIASPIPKENRYRGINGGKSIQFFQYGSCRCVSNLILLIFLELMQKHDMRSLDLF